MQQSTLTHFQESLLLLVIVFTFIVILSILWNRYYTNYLNSIIEKDKEIRNKRLKFIQTITPSKIQFNTLTCNILQENIEEISISEALSKLWTYK